MFDHGVEQLIDDTSPLARQSPGRAGALPAGWSLGARFYPVLYALTRVGDAQDGGTGLALKHHIAGPHECALEVHHIFPRALLYREGFQKSQVNAVANFCFLTKGTNLQISDRPPAEYFAEIEERHPGAPRLTVDSRWTGSCGRRRNYPRFLDERQRLLAEAANALLDDLLHDASAAEPVGPATVAPVEATAPAAVPGGIEDAEEEGGAPSHQRVGARARTPRGPHRTRARAPRHRRPARHPRPRLAERPPGRLQ